MSNHHHYPIVVAVSILKEFFSKEISFVRLLFYVVDTIQFHYCFADVFSLLKMSLRSMDISPVVCVCIINIIARYIDRRQKAKNCPPFCHCRDHLFSE